MNSINESEQNDSLVTPDDLTLGDTLTGQLSSAEDLDVYRLSLSNASVVNVVFDVPTDTTYLEYFQLGLYDSNGELNSLFETGRDQTYRVGVASPGDYYVAISAPQYTYDSGNYHLTVTQTEEDTNSFETEFNGSLLSADDLILGQSITGQLASDEELDVFHLYAPSPGVFNVEFDVPTDSA